MSWQSNADTRRRRHGKMIGGHSGGSYSGNGRFLKNFYWRAERHYWKRYSLAILAHGDTEREIIVSMKSLVGAFSEVDWKGW